MKRFALIITILLALAAPAARADVAAADSAYMQDDFLSAAALYQEAIDSLGPSAERLYNLGNAYYRAGLPGMAIVSYERALRLDPSNQDIKENLEFVNSRIVDRLPDSSSLIGGATDRLASAWHPNAWAWVGIVTFLLALGGVFLYFLMDSVMLRKVGFFGAGILLLCCIGANVLAYRSSRAISASNAAVVVTPSAILSTTPRQPKDRSEEAMLLHEGTKVTILDSIPGTGQDRMWYDVRVDKTRRAWISSQSLEII